MALAPHAGAVFLLACAEITTLGELEASVKRLRQSGARINGVIFNDLSASSRRSGSKYSSYRYTPYGYAPKGGRNVSTMGKQDGHGMSWTLANMGVSRAETVGVTLFR